MRVVWQTLGASVKTNSYSLSIMNGILQGYSQQRESWLDCMRGILILLVAWGHITHYYLEYYNCFYMGAFFFISGYFYNSQTNLRVLMLKRAKQILVPCFTLGLVIYIINEFAKGVLRDSEDGITLHKLAFYCINNPYWFLPCLFLAQMLQCLIIKLCKNNSIVLLFVSGGICVLVVSFIRMLNLPETVWTKIPWHLQTALVVQFFMVVAYTVHKYEIVRYFQNILALIILSVVYVALLNYTINQYHFCISDIRSVYYAAYHYVPLAMCGTFLTVSISYYLKWSKVLQFVGKHSLVIYITHVFIFKMVEAFLNKVFGVLNVTDLTLFSSIFPFAFFPVSVALGAWLSVILKKYAPWVLGGSIHPVHRV